MPRDRYTRDCRVPGCTAKLVDWNDHAHAHEHQPHQRCSCGWVGVSHAKHVAQRRRYHGPNSAHVEMFPAPTQPEPTS